MVAKIMRKVLASIALVSVLSAQIISTNALSLSEDLTSETVNRTAVMLSAEERRGAPRRFLHRPKGTGGDGSHRRGLCGISAFCQRL